MTSADTPSQSFPVSLPATSKLHPQTEQPLLSHSTKPTPNFTLSAWFHFASEKSSFNSSLSKFVAHSSVWFKTLSQLSPSLVCDSVSALRLFAS